LATVCPTPVTELGWRYMRKYTELRTAAVEKAQLAREAKASTDPAKTRRLERLERTAQTAQREADAAKYMLKILVDAIRELDEACLRAWIIERIGSYDWRTAYDKTLCLVDA